ncbi:MAG: hypothetical protein ACYDHX_06450 [Methanothrix sp.]
MKDFAGSSITYYGLAREKLMNKFPRLTSVLVILALICMTGLAIFLISDLVSFASNPDHKGVSVGLDLKGPENSIVTMTDDKEKSGNISVNSSAENLSRQTKEQNVANLSKMNASLPSSQAAKGVVAASKSSPVIKHHSSSSSSSSSTSSSAKSAKKSNDKNNLTNETATSSTPTNQSMNNSQGNESGFLNATSSVDLPPIDAAKSAIANSSNISNEGQSSVLSDQESENAQRSNDSEVAPTAILASLPSVAVSSITNPAKDTSAREPESIIKFKTASPSSQKSEQGLNTDSGINTDGASVSDNGNKAQSSKDTKKKPNSKAIGTKSASSQKSKVTASGQAKKAQEARSKQIANRNRMAENLKKKAAQSRAKAARN